MDIYSTFYLPNIRQILINPYATPVKSDSYDMVKSMDFEMRCLGLNPNSPLSAV